MVERMLETVTEMADTYLGNVRESADLTWRVAQARDDGRCLEVVIGRSDRPKARIMARATNGQQVGIVKSREWLLRDGDVLATNQRHMVLVALDQQQVMVMRFEEGSGNRRPLLWRGYANTLIRLGHVLGNHHWPLVIDGDELYVEMMAEPAVMERIVREAADQLGIKGLTISFEQRSPHEALNFAHTHEH